MGRAPNFVNEIRRRNVFRTGVAYLVLAWLVVKVANVLPPVFEVPVWLLRLAIVLLVIGLPVVLVLAWLFEITATGLKRTGDATVRDSTALPTGRRLDFIIIGILVAVLGVSLYANLQQESGPVELPDPVSILIADFADNIGNENLAGALEDTLGMGLELARFVETYSRTEARNVAREIDASIDGPDHLELEVASLVALRQGIDIVLSGNVSRSEDKLMIEVAGTNPGDQRTLFEVVGTAKDETEILSAIIDLANQIRVKLGDDEVTSNLDDRDSFVVGNLAAAAEYVRAQEFQADRHLEDSIQHYTKAIDLDPDFTRAYVGRAIAQQQLGRSKQAAEDWEFVMARLTDLTERGQLRTLGSYYGMVTLDWEKALETYERLVDRYPADSVGQNNLAVAAFYNLDFERAQTAGRIVVDRYPGHSIGKSNLALYTMYAGKFVEANSLAQELILQDRQNMDGWLVAALSRLMAGNLAEAKSTYLQMKSLDDYGRSIALEGLADLELYQHNHSAAIGILEDGIALDLVHNMNEFAAIKHVMLAESYQRTGDLEAAIGAIKDGLEIGTGDASVVRAAILLAELGEYEMADAIASQLSNELSDIRRAYAHTVRATIASNQGQPANAVELAKRAIDGADLWLARFVLGKVYLDAGYLFEAFNEFQICKDRSGEGIAVFLDDRPSFRMIRELDTAIEKTNKLMRETQD
jgi:tetratricopeptide (TPR) repeat protein